MLELLPSGFSGLPTDRLAALPPVGADLRIVHSSGGEFSGVVTAHIIETTRQGEHLRVEVKHKLANLLEDIVDSRRTESSSQRNATNHTEEFNVNSRRSTWASDSVIAIGGRRCRTFDSSPSARRWTVADALGYLLAVHSPVEVTGPSLEELTALAGEIDLGTYDATGKPLALALTEVAHRGGLELRAARQGLALVFYRSASPGCRRSVRLAPEGTSLSTTTSNLWHAKIKTSRRPSRRGVLALGEKKIYEATFMLSGGWDSSLETASWRDFVRSLSPRWNTLADVYRKWVLNEHDWYCQSPWNLPSGDLSWLDPEAFFLKTPRKFLNCLSCDASGKSLGIVTEYRVSGENDWNIWGGPVQISPDECAIYLGGDALPGKFFHAAVQGAIQVRLTAALAADASLSAIVPGDAGQPMRVVDCQSVAAWRKVHSSSVLAGENALGLPAERDDSLLLQRIANRHAQMEARAVSAELTLGWIDASFHVGDLVDRIDGRGMDLASTSLGQPLVSAVRHNFTEQTTTLVVNG